MSSIYMLWQNHHGCILAKHTTPTFQKVVKEARHEQKGWVQETKIYCSSNNNE